MRLMGGLAVMEMKILLMTFQGGGFAGEIGVPRLLNLFRQKGDKMESQNYKIEEALIIPDINKK